MPEQKTKRKKATKKATKKAVRNTCGKGIGKKLAVYVPKCDEFVIDAIEELKQAHQRKGYRTSLSYELIRLAKLGLEHKDAKN